MNALVGAFGILFGVMLYAFLFEWVRDNILSVSKLGRVTLPQLLGVPPLALHIGLSAFALAFFYSIERMRIDKHV